MLPPVSWSADEMSTVSSHGDGAEQPELTQINDHAKQSCAVLCCVDVERMMIWMVAGWVRWPVWCSATQTIQTHNIEKLLLIQTGEAQNMVLVITLVLMKIHPKKSTRAKSNN